MSTTAPTPPRGSRARLLLLLLAGCLLPAPAARADLIALKASCSQPLHPADAPALAYRKCDDGVPGEGGTTANPSGERAVLVPAGYRWPAATGMPDPTVDGLPPPAADPGCTEVPGSAPSTTVPGTCTVALDVDLSLPSTPAPAGGYPVVVLMHGCCGGSKTSWESDRIGPSGELWHYNNAWLASRGYVVVTYTSRGFVNGNGQGSTGETQLDSLQYEMNDMQSLTGQLADDPTLHIDPQRIVVTGGSYGGGFSWLALVDPTWRSPGGRAMKLAAVAPKYGWTDLVDSLVPTGRQFYDLGPLPAINGSDSGMQPLGSKQPQLLGIPKQSIVAALYASGKTGVPPGSSHATFPASVDQAFGCTQSAYPAESNPACAQTIATVLPDFIRYRSAYYWNEFFTRIRTDPSARIPVFSAGTLTDPLFPPLEHRRMVDRLQAVIPGYPVQEYYGDYQHFTPNKDREWDDTCGSDHHICAFADYPRGDLNADPANLVRTGATTLLNRFIDHYAAPSGDAAAPVPSFGATATTQVCVNRPLGRRSDEPGPSFTAPTFADLAPGRLKLDFTGEQVTTNRVPSNQHAADADPLANQVDNGKACVIETSPPGLGVAAYDSPPLRAAATMIGGSLLTVDLATSGTTGLELNARLYDLLPDGSAILVDRGPRRIDPARDGTSHVTFQLHGNGWGFRSGDRVRIELAQDDAPYLAASSVPSSITISHVHLEIPIHELSGTTVHTRPAVVLRAPRLASTVSMSPRFRVGWRGSDIGDHIAAYELQVSRRIGHRAAPWRVAGRYSARTTGATVAGVPGATLRLRLRAVDSGGNVSAPADATTIVPTLARPPRAVLRGPWRIVRSRGAFGGRLITGASPRCTLRWRYLGGEVDLIARVGRAGGRVRMWLDGGPGRTIDLRRLRPADRVVVVRVARRLGWHTMRLQVLGPSRRGDVPREVWLNGFAVAALAP